MMVIFLDIDGVLVTARAMCEARELGRIDSSSKINESFDRDAVDVFNKLVYKTGAKIVISSSWRIHETVKSMQSILDTNGVKCEVIGLTDIDPDDIRGLEIWKWLLDHKGEWTDYLVIDDEGKSLANYIPASKLVYVKDGLMGAGLTEEHLRACSSVAEQQAVNLPTSVRFTPSPYELVQRRIISCAACHKEEIFLVKYTYNEGWKIVKAEVVKLPDGWTYQPIGTAGGQAPYCAACQLI